jgi:hypothetical protein
MPGTVVSLGDQIVEVRYPVRLAVDIEGFLGRKRRRPGAPPNRIVISEQGADRYALVSHCREPMRDIDKAAILNVVMEEIVRSLVFDLASGVALHAGAVGWHDRSILVAGRSGSGKTALVAWFVDNGFDYLSDELAVLLPEERIVAFPRPLVVKRGARAAVAALAVAKGGRALSAGDNTILALPGGKQAKDGRPCRFIILAEFAAGVELSIEPISQAQTVVRLMECNLNARNLADHGLAAIKALAMAVPAVRLRYGDFEQLGGVADSLVRLMADSPIDASAARGLLLALAPGPPLIETKPAEPPPASPPEKRPIPSATTAQFTKKLTVGMATYDDYDGVYFTIQALRLYHPEIVEETEFLVIDNHPDGVCAQPLKDLETWIPNYRYVPRTDRSGTAIRDAIFEEAGGTYVLCLDCHVFIFPNAARRLLAYFDAHPETNDLLQGPMVYDDLTSTSTHFHPAWRSGMYGRWDKDPAGLEVDGEPFDIPMQGLGLFACRKAAWPGFNPNFRGFGGEEGYIHEKFRRAGGRTLCLPFLRWVHRFGRPLGVPYRNIWEDRIRNYLIAFTELGLPTTELESHFKELLGEPLATKIIADVRRELSPGP